MKNFFEESDPLHTVREKTPSIYPGCRIFRHSLLLCFLCLIFTGPLYSQDFDSFEPEASNPFLEGPDLYNADEANAAAGFDPSMASILPPGWSGPTAGKCPAFCKSCKNEACCDPLCLECTKQDLPPGHVCQTCPNCYENLAADLNMCPGDHRSGPCDRECTCCGFSDGSVKKDRRCCRCLGPRCGRPSHLEPRNACGVPCGVPHDAGPAACKSLYIPDFYYPMLRAPGGLFFCPGAGPFCPGEDKDKKTRYINWQTGRCFLIPPVSPPVHSISCSNLDFHRCEDDDSDSDGDLDADGDDESDEGDATEDDDQDSDGSDDDSADEGTESDTDSDGNSDSDEDGDSDTTSDDEDGSESDGEDGQDTDTDTDTDDDSESDSDGNSDSSEDSGEDSDEEDSDSDDDDDGGDANGDEDGDSDSDIPDCQHEIDELEDKEDEKEILWIFRMLNFGSHDPDPFPRECCQQAEDQNKELPPECEETPTPTPSVTPTATRTPTSTPTHFPTPTQYPTVPDWPTDDDGEGDFDYDSDGQGDWDIDLDSDGSDGTGDFDSDGDSDLDDGGDGESDLTDLDGDMDSDASSDDFDSDGTDLIDDDTDGSDRGDSDSDDDQNPQCDAGCSLLCSARGGCYCSCPCTTCDTPRCSIGMTHAIPPSCFCSCPPASRDHRQKMDARTR